MINTTNFTEENSLKTSNNTFQSILAHTVPHDASGFLTYKVVAQRTSDKATVGWVVSGSYKRDGSNAPTSNTELLSGVLGSTGDKLALLALAVNFTNDPNNIILQVKGLSGTDVIWYVILETSEMYEGS